jgi:predicted dehydrogenase
MTSPGPVRAAILGAGLMGRWHARAVKRAGGSVAVVVDPDASRAVDLARAHRAGYARTLGEAVSSGASIDAVHVCTPLESHDALAREAIELGLHVLVEKPLVATAAATADLLRCAGERGVLVCPVHQFPFQRGVRALVAALPAIGPVVHVAAITCSAGGENSDADGRGRIAADVLPHPLSLFSAILGVPVASIDWQVSAPAPGELRAWGGAQGATLSIVVSMSGRPTRNAVHVIGARGSAHADLFHGFLVRESGAVSRARKIVQPLAHASATFGAAVGNLARRAVAGESAYPGLRTLVAEFYAAIRGTAPPPISVAQALDIAIARDAILAPARRENQKIV